MKTEGRPQEIIREMVRRNEAAIEEKRPQDVRTIDWIFLSWLWSDFQEVLTALALAQGETDVEACGVTAEEQKKWYYLATEFQDCGHPKDCVLCDGDGRDYCPLCENERSVNRLHSMYQREREKMKEAQERAETAESVGYAKGVAAAKDSAIDAVQGAMMELGRPDREYLNRWGHEVIREIQKDLDALLPTPPAEEAS